MYNFVSQGHPVRVVFGAGSMQHLGREIEALGARKVLIVCAPGQRATARIAADLLATRAVGTFDRSGRGAISEQRQAAGAMAQELAVDCALAIGGGSTIDLAKAIAAQSGVVLLTMPTTYSGAEMAPFLLGIDPAKAPALDRRVLPRTIIYDPELGLGLPAATSVASGIQAIAHAAEGLYAPDGNPLHDLLAQEGLRSVMRALPLIGGDPSNIAARSYALYGSWLCASVLGGVRMGLHHGLCEVLSQSFGLPHAEAHAAVLPHVLSFNAQAAPRAMQKIAQILGTQNAAQAVFGLARDNGAAVALRAIGMQEADLDRASELVLQRALANPRPLELVALRELLQHAFDGRTPA
ncbi:MAG: maleylacetate reductase [Burkholderiaceae bacterium]